MTVDELTRALGLTRTAVRAQLVSLEREGEVTRRSVRLGRTKPAHVYELTAEAEARLSRAYVPVLTHLLHVLAARLGQRELDAVMRDVGRALVTGHPRPRGPLRARAQAASDLLNGFGGIARVERNERGLVIRSDGCPLSATAVAHRETCSAMESLVAAFLDTPVVQRCERGERPRCRFEISPTGDGARAG